MPHWWYICMIYIIKIVENHVRFINFHNQEWYILAIFFLF